MTTRALPLLLLAALGAGCLSAPPSGVITCDNTCPITGYYCGGDGFCWANGEYPSLTSGSSTGSSSTGGSGSGGSGSSSSTGKTSASSGGSSTGHSGGTGTGTKSTGSTSTGSTTGP